MTPIEKKLDKLVQSLSNNHRCHVCGRDATAVHHIISRSNKLLRYDIVNLLPVCYDCHRNIHDGKVDVKRYIAKEQWDYLQDVKNMSLKDHLLYLGTTLPEFYKDCEISLKRLLNEND